MITQRTMKERVSIIETEVQNIKKLIYGVMILIVSNLGFSIVM